MAGGDEWDELNKHLNSMNSIMDWANNATSQVQNQRQGHIHRRSEPDVDMIRQARISRNNTVQLPVPQSAPVQPGTFQLDWNSMPKRKLASSEDEPIEDADFIQDPAKLGQFPELDAFAASTQSETVTNHMVLNVSHRIGSSDPAQLISVHDHGFPVESPPKPPPYPRVHHTNGPVMQNRPFDQAGGSFHPRPVASELPFNSNHMFPSITAPRNNHPYGYPSPRSYRRSSVPVNQPDPRAHSASPNIARRSISTMQRRRTQDNLMTIPTIIQNTEMNAVGSHPTIPVGPASHTSLFTSKPPPDAAISSFSTLPSKKADDQEYTIVLLQHQRDRMQRLQKELEAKKKLLVSLSSIVTGKEKEVFEKKGEKTSTNMPTLNDVTKLRELNREMEIDCNCMIKEVDMVSKSGNSVGGNFHELVGQKTFSGSLRGKKPPASDLPSPPLPPPPVPPPDDPEDDTKWSCKWCTFLNHAALNKCEVCEYRRERD